jgi:hypothetical protein
VLTNGFHAGRNDHAFTGDKIRSSGMYLMRMNVVHKNNDRQEHFSKQLSILQ